MGDIYDYLHAVERRPEMYFGGPECAHRLDLLESLIWGYEGALWTHDIDAPGRGFMREFADYLRARFGWSSSLGPIHAIRQQAADDEAALAQFFQLVTEFRGDRGEAAGS